MLCFRDRKASIERVKEIVDASLIRFDHDLGEGIQLGASSFLFAVDLVLLLNKARMVVTKLRYREDQVGLQHFQVSLGGGLFLCIRPIADLISMP